jgi:hypothetical protein
MSHEAIRGRHARVQAQLETFSKIGLVGNLAAMSTEDSAVAARVTRIGLIDYRVNSTIGEDGRDYGWDAWKYIVYTDGTEKPLLCRTFGTEDEAWTMCERWKMADDRKRSSTAKIKLPKNIPANPETCSPVSNVDIEDSENAKLKVLMRL